MIFYTCISMQEFEGVSLSIILIMNAYFLHLKSSGNQKVCTSTQKVHTYVVHMTTYERKIPLIQQNNIEGAIQHFLFWYYLHIWVEFNIGKRSERQWNSEEIRKNSKAICFLHSEFVNSVYVCIDRYMYGFGLIYPLRYFFCQNLFGR